MKPLQYTAKTFLTFTGQLTYIFLFFVDTARYDEERRLILGRQEMLNYLREKKRRALPSTSKRVSSIRHNSCFVLTKCLV